MATKLYINMGMYIQTVSLLLCSPVGCGAKHVTTSKLTSRVSCRVTLR